MFHPERWRRRLIPMDDEPTERGPLGQQPLYRRRIRPLQLRPDRIEFSVNRLLGERFVPGRFLDDALREPLRPRSHNLPGNTRPDRDPPSNARTPGDSSCRPRPPVRPIRRFPDPEPGFPLGDGRSSAACVATSLISVSSAIGLCVCETRPQSSPRRPRPGRDRTIPRRPFPPRRIPAVPPGVLPLGHSIQSVESNHVGHESPGLPGPEVGRFDSASVPLRLVVIPTAVDGFPSHFYPTLPPAPR